MGRKTLSKSLRGRKILRSTALLPVVLSAMLATTTPSPVMAMQSFWNQRGYSRHSNSNAYYYNKYTPHISNSYIQNGKQDFNMRLSSYENNGMLNSHRPNDNPIQFSMKDDLGRDVKQQSYGGFSGLMSSYHTGNIGSFSPWLPKNYYFTADDSKKEFLHGTINNHNFNQTILSTVRDKAKFNVTINSSLRAAIELITGTITANGHMSWNEGFKLAIRAVDDRTTYHGIDLIVHHGALFHGAIQASNNNDQIYFYGGKVTSSPHFPGYDYIDLRDGDDIIEFDGKHNTNSGTYIDGNIFAGYGNDTIGVYGGRVETKINGYLYGGPGNDLIHLKSNNSIYIGGILAGDGDDSLMMDASRVTLKLGTIYMGSGNDHVSVYQDINTIYDLGSGNNTVVFYGGKRHANARIVTGRGNSIIDIGTSQYENDIYLGDGHNTISVEQGGSYKSRNNIAINPGTSLLLNANGNRGSITINGSINNYGVLRVYIGNRAEYRGPLGNGSGSLDMHVYDGSTIHSNIRSGRGNDRFRFERMSTNFDIDGGEGRNIFFLNSATVGSIKSAGDDLTIFSSARVRNVELTTNSQANKDIGMSNVSLTGDRFDVNAGNAVVRMYLGNTLDITNQNLRMNVSGRITDIDIEHLQMRGNTTPLTFNATDKSNITLRGNIHLGDIIFNSRNNAGNTVDFENVTTSSFGTLKLDNGSNKVRLDNSRFNGNINFGNENGGDGDTLWLINSTIQNSSSIEYDGKFTLHAQQASVFNGNIDMKKKTNVYLEDSSVVTGSLYHRTTELIYLGLRGTSQMRGKLDIDKTKALNLYIDGRDSALFSTNIESGSPNDTIRVELMDNINFTGFIHAGEGNNSLVLDSSSQRASIQKIEAGSGHDTVIFKKGHFNGGLNFRLGEGNNSISVEGNTTVTGDILIYEVQNSKTDIVVKRDAELHANINTGAVQGDVRLEDNSLLNGSIRGASTLNLIARNNSIIKGGITAGNGDTDILLEGTLVEGNIESNRGKKVAAEFSNSTIRGNFNAVTNSKGVDFVMTNSVLNGALRADNIVFSGKKSTFESGMIIQGSSFIKILESVIDQNITVGRGASTVSLGTNTISGGLTVTDGEYGITLSSNIINGNLDIRQSAVTLHSTGDTVKGDVIVAASRVYNGNELTFSKGRVDGSIFLKMNNRNNSIKLRDASVGKDIALGLGENTLMLSNSTVEGTIELRGKTTLVLDNTTVNNKLEFNDPALDDQDITIIGKRWEAFELGNVNNTVVIKDAIINKNNDIITTPGSNGAENYAFKGGNFVDNITFINTGILGDILLGEEDKVAIRNSYVKGAVHLDGIENTVVLNNAFVTGDITAKEIQIEGVVSTYTSTTKANGLPIEFKLGRDNLNNRSARSTTYINPNSIFHVGAKHTGDVLELSGDIHVNSGAIGIDVDFLKGDHDTVKVNQNAQIHGKPGLLYVTPINVFTGKDKLLERIDGVLVAEGVNSFQYIPQLVNNYVAIGGYLYQLRPDEKNNNQFNLVIAGENPMNFGYGAMVLSGKNYSRAILDSLQEQSLSNMIATSAERKSYGRKNKKDLVSAWVQVGVLSNSISAPFIPKVESSLVTALAGVDLKEIDIKGKDRLGLRVFGGYGTSRSKYMYESLEVAGDMSAYSGGLQFTWENLRNSKYHAFIRSTTWADTFTNSLYNAISYTSENWTSTTISTSLATGIRMKFNNFIIIPEAELVYSYHTGSTFVSAASSLIEIPESHQLLAKVQGTAAYNFAFGLTPYMRVSLEIPITNFPNDSNGIYVTGKFYKHTIDDILTRFSTGLNYAVSFGGVDITTYIDAAVHFGRENGFKGSLGVAVGF